MLWEIQHEIDCFSKLDFNSGGDKIEQNLPKFIDVVRLFDAMSTLVGMKVNCDPKGIVNSGNAISEEKRKMKVVSKWFWNVPFFNEE